MKTLVIGASTKPHRTSYEAINLLRSYDHEVVAIGGQRGKLGDVDIVARPVRFEEVDTVSIYLRPSLQGQYQQYLLDLKPRRVIFNPGAENHARQF